MKNMPLAGVEWTVRLTRSLLPNSPAVGLAHERGWTADKHEGQETRILKLTLPGDHATTLGKSEELRAAWEADGWTVATQSWRTRNRLPKPAVAPEEVGPLLRAGAERFLDDMGEEWTPPPDTELPMAAATGDFPSTAKEEAGPESLDNTLTPAAPGAENGGAGSDVLGIPPSLRREKKGAVG